MTIQADPKTLPLQRYTLHLREDSTTYTDRVLLPFIHSPTDSASARESIQIHLKALLAPQDTLWLHYKAVGEIAWKKAMMESTAVSFAGDTIHYSASIPAQNSPGELFYYIRTRIDQRIFSGESSPHKAIVTKEGVLSKLILSPNDKKIPTGVPILLEIRAYDGVNKLLIPTQVDWRIVKGAGNFTGFSTDSTRVWFKCDTDTTTYIEANAIYEGVALCAFAKITTETRILDQLAINSPQLSVSNQDSVLFTYAAADTGGVLMSIWSQWEYAPESSGELIPDEKGETAIFKPDSTFIGQVQIYLIDRISGRRVAFNSSEEMDVGDCGLKIYQVVSASNSQMRITDSEGFVLTVPANAADAGASLKIKLSKPQIPDVKRYTGEYKVRGEIYSLTLTGRMKAGQTFTMELPVERTARGKKLNVGYWDLNALNWIPLQSTPKDTSLVTQISEFAEYAVLQTSDPLGIKNVQLLPNPFTAYDPYGLQIGFSLSSNDARKPCVTVKIYNMLGEHVRTLCDNESMAPEDYPPGGDNTLMWDGKTYDGNLARNGRYMVLITARDNTGEEKVLKAVVLIK